MTSIDELFQKSGIPSKRKADPIRDPNEIYKATKATSSSGGSRHARVEDEDDIEAGPAPPPEGDGDDEDEDGDYGPTAPPGDDDDDDDDEDEGDDEEGRFFGGGITRTEAKILAYVDGDGHGNENDDQKEEKYDAAWLRRTALQFEKRINRNAELRARYESEPTKFIGSEADLDAAIRNLSIVGEHPALYGELARLGTVASLVGLLAHENSDIAIAAIQVLDEWTDEDVNANEDQWTSLVKALLDADLVGLLVSNLKRLKDDSEDNGSDDVDRTGIYKAMSIIENLCSPPTPPSTPNPAADALAASDDLIVWLLQRASRTESPVSQNKQYAAELLALLPQQASAAKRQALAGRPDLIDGLLQMAAAYRRRDPAKGDGSESEFMEDLFQALTALVREDDIGKTRFVEAEGVELCLLILDGGKEAHHHHKSSSSSAGRLRSVQVNALRVLDHVSSSGSGTSAAAAQVCEHIVDGGGLKTLFTMFKRGEGKKPKEKKEDKSDKNDKKDLDQWAAQTGRITEHLVGIMASMLRLLPAESAQRIRLLAKFVENDYEKIQYLAALRRLYGARMAVAEKQHRRAFDYIYDGYDSDDYEEQHEKDMRLGDLFGRRLDAGLFLLRSVDLILAWLVAEDTGTRSAVEAALNDGNRKPLAVLQSALKERLREIDDRTRHAQDTREMLTTLLTFF